jgi:hypothetical protein
MATATRAKGKKVAKDLGELAETAGPEARLRVTRLAKSVVDLEKTTFDNSAKVVGKMQERSEKLLLDVVDHAEWMAPEVKKAVHEWVKMMRRSRGDFKKTMDKSFTLIDQCLVRMQKAEGGKLSKPGNGRASAKKSAKSAKTTRRAKPATAKKRSAPRKRSAAAAAA